MTQDITQGFVAVKGNILSFPIGSTILYGANTNPPVGYIDHGFATEDGVSVTVNRSNTNILTWQGSQVMRVITTESSVEVTFTLQQINDENAELAYMGVKNLITGAYHVNAGKTAEHRGYFIDGIDVERNKKIRYYLADAQVINIGEQTINAGGLIQFEVTLMAYRVDVEGEEANHLVWIEDYSVGS